MTPREQSLLRDEPVEYALVETPIPEQELSEADVDGASGEVPAHWLVEQNVVARPRVLDQKLKDDHADSAELGLLRTLAYDEKLDSEKSEAELAAERRLFGDD